jgi:hypothetical protein
MNTARIEDNPGALTKFVELVQAGQFTAAKRLLHDHTIDERTVRGLNTARLLDEIRLFASSYEPQLRRRILIPEVVRPPHVATSERALYQLRHHDMLEAFGTCLSALVRFGVHARRADCSTELIAWAEARAHELTTGDRIARHFDLTESPS